MSELDEVRRELSSILNELESISGGIRNDFKGIGQEKCASAIDRVIHSYRGTLRTMNQITVRTEFSAGGGAGGGGGKAGGR